MKKWAILLLFIFAGLVGCKKKAVKPAQDTSPNGLITRITWHTTHFQHSYYNETDGRIYKTTDSVGVAFNFKNGQVQITDLNNNVKSGTYSITESNTGGQLLNLTFNNQTETYGIDSLTENLFYFSQQKLNVTYTNNGTQYPAAKEITTVNLHCDCN
jgi:hypothetical protein